MKKIYLVEDEKNLCILLGKYLTKEGYCVTTFTDGNSAIKHVSELPHLWILDINLPGHDGYEIIKAIKALYPNMPVIFISARNEELDRVIGLEMGSDDYLAKPFLPRELVIRTNRLLNRIYENSAKTSDKNILFVDSYHINLNNRTLTYNNDEIQLTSKEFDLMYYLVKNKNQALSREQVLIGVWGMDYFGSDRVVDDTIRRLRKKLCHATIDTIYGYGYKWVSNS